jgi:hypothetical protein
VPSLSSSTYCSCGRRRQSVARVRSERWRRAWRMAYIETRAQRLDESEVKACAGTSFVPQKQMHSLCSRHT